MIPALIVALVMSCGAFDGLAAMILSLADGRLAAQQAENSGAVSDKPRVMACGYVSPILVDEPDATAATGPGEQTTEGAQRPGGP